MGSAVLSGYRLHFQRPNDDVFFFSMREAERKLGQKQIIKFTIKTEGTGKKLTVTSLLGFNKDTTGKRMSIILSTKKTLQEKEMTIN